MGGEYLKRALKNFRIATSGSRWVLSPLKDLATVGPALNSNFGIRSQPRTRPQMGAAWLCLHEGPLLALCWNALSRASSVSDVALRLLRMDKSCPTGLYTNLGMKNSKRGLTSNGALPNGHSQLRMELTLWLLARREKDKQLIGLLRKFGKLSRVLKNAPLNNLRFCIAGLLGYLG